MNTANHLTLSIGSGTISFEKGVYICEKKEMGEYKRKRYITKGHAFYKKGSAEKFIIEADYDPSLAGLLSADPMTECAYSFRSLSGYTESGKCFFSAECEYNGTGNKIRTVRV